MMNSPNAIPLLPALEPTAMGRSTLAAIAVAMLAHGLLLGWCWRQTAADPAVPPMSRDISISLVSDSRETAQAESRPPAPPKAPVFPVSPAPARPQPVMQPAMHAARAPSKASVLSSPNASSATTAPAPATVPASEAPSSPTQAVVPAAPPASPRVSAQSGGAASPGISPPRFDAAYLSNPAPSYPALSRRLGEQGKVLLRVQVDADGAPLEVSLHQSCGAARLDEAALAAVRRWKFQPARQAGQAVPASVIVPIDFKLKSTSGEAP